MKLFTKHYQPTSLKGILLLAFVCLFTTTNLLAQYNVSEIITDYNGYWKSSASSINTTKPDNSHNLVSFSFNGNRYSTGVNDLLLTTRLQSFIPGDYRALPVSSISSVVNGNTKIGLGNMYDGVANGPSSVSPVNNIPKYLTDGVKGLDLGTCVANLPSGTLFFAVSNLKKSAVADGIPDLVITQVADPSGSLDRYEFTDINGARVGNYVDIKLDNIPSVGNWTADFYEASSNPMTLQGGFTKTDRPIRLWTSELSAFGIDSSNISQIAYFKINLSGNSDVAFVAYNNNAININSSLLPVKLGNFSGTSINKNQVQLNWQSLTEVNSHAFTIERSIDGINFTTTGYIMSAGYTVLPVNYSFTDKNAPAGRIFYRLKQTDNNGSFEYSKIIEVNTAAPHNVIAVYPNPAGNFTILNHPLGGSNDQCQLISMNGGIILQKKITMGSFQTKIDLTQVAKGSYRIVWTNGKDITSNSLLII